MLVRVVISFVVMYIHGAVVLFYEIDQCYALKRASGGCNIQYALT